VHADHLNTPKMITRPVDNAVMWRWDQDPFGTAAPNQNPAAQGIFVYNLRYPGQYYDSETGLSYNYFRDYDAQVGRYVESDPIGLAGGVNTYEYAGDAPPLLTDSLGMFTSQRHGEISVRALTETGISQECFSKAVAASIMLDYVPGALSTALAHQHSMARPGQTSADAARQSNDYIQEQIKKCDCSALGFALHTAQDSAAGGHHYETYTGSVSLWHLIQDQFPSSDAVHEAIVKSKNVIDQYQRSCSSCRR
jgi:RHS repeat-associated protein